MKRSWFIISCVIVMVWSSLALSPVQAKEGNVTPQGVEVENALFLKELGGISYTITVDPTERYIYFSSGSRIYVAEVSPETGIIQQVSSTESIGGTIYHIVLTDDRVYAATAEAGVVVLDRTDPMRLTLLGGIRRGDVYNLIVMDNLVYAAEVTGGISIFDFSDPNKPTLQGVIGSPTEKYYTIRADQGYLYAPRYNGGIDIFQFNTPTDLSWVTTIAYGGSQTPMFISFIIDGPYGYVGAGGYLAVYDLANRTYLGENWISIIAYNLWLHEDTLYIPSDAAVCTLDVSNRATPVGNCAQPFYDQYEVLDMAIGRLSGHVYLASIEGLRILDPSGKNELDAFILPLVYSDDIEIRDGFIYGVNYLGLRITDLNGTTVMETPIPNTRVFFTHCRIELLSRDHRLYAVIINDLGLSVYVYDVTDPTNAILIANPASGFLPPYSFSIDFTEIIDDKLYVRQENKLHIVGLSDLTAPTLIATIDRGMGLKQLKMYKWVPPTEGSQPEAARVVVMGTYASKTAIIDVTDPSHPIFKTAVNPNHEPISAFAAFSPTPGSNEPTVIFAYHGSEKAVHAYRFSDLVQGSQIQFTDLNLESSLSVGDEIVDMVVGNHYLALLTKAGATGIIQFYDIDTSFQLSPAGYIKAPGYYQNIDANDGQLIGLFDPNNGLKLLYIGCQKMYLPMIAQ